MTDHEPHELRGSNGKFMRDPATAVTDARAAELRSRGLSYRAIAAEMGWSHQSSAHEAVARAMAQIITEPATAARDLELDRLDLAYRKTLAVLERQHVTVSNGKIITLDDVPLQDDGPILAAVDRLVRISESRRKLLGLDQPAKVSVDGGLRYEVVGIDPSALQ